MLLQPDLEHAVNKHDPVVIYGNDGMAVQLANCCLPIPGDSVVGQLKRDQGVTAHIADCQVAKRLLIKEPERWIDVKWHSDINRLFDCRIRLLMTNEQGMLARIAAEIGDADANIRHIEMQEDKLHEMTELSFTVQVKDRVHLARLIRNVRRTVGVTRVLRERGQS